jgi:hypothetical protein
VRIDAPVHCQCRRRLRGQVPGAAAAAGNGAVPAPLTSRGATKAPKRAEGKCPHDFSQNQQRDP